MTVLAPATRPQAPPSDHRPPDRSPTPGLQALPTPVRRPANGLFALLVLGLLMTGMVGYLMLQTSLQEQAVSLHQLNQEADILRARESYLRAGLATRTTAQELARSARDLGLTPNLQATFIDLTAGQVVGANQAATGDEAPGLSRPVAPAPVVPAVPVVADPAAVDPAVDPAAPDAAADSAADAAPPVDGEAVAGEVVQ
ncbi:MAG: hypothetical protein LBK42_02920 [Propionibacteriaceae bacterium]|jgi:hypothetical protein|nr:hypothetical protein [Propionibacteriaceae bacterium]